MVTSNYSTPQLPDVQTQTPVTPVNTGLIKAVEGLGDVAIEVRKAQNEAIDQQFLSAGAEYFRNISSQISSDESRKTAMLFSALEVAESKGNLTPEGEQQLKKFRADFGDLKNAAEQGTISTLQLKTRAQAVLTNATIARPDLGDEIRKVATDILGADITHAAETLYSTIIKTGLEAGKEAADIFKAQIDQAEKFVSYAPDQQSYIKNLTVARSLGDTPEGRKALADAQMQFSVDVNGFQALALKTADDIGNEVDIKLSGPDFTNRLYSTDSQIASEARNEGIQAIQRLSAEIESLNSFTGINSGMAKAKAERLSIQRTLIQAKIDVQGDPVKAAQVDSAQREIMAHRSVPAAKDAYARARPAGDAGKMDEALVSSASVGYTVKMQAGERGYVKHDVNLGPRSYDGYNRLPILWNVSEAATPSALDASVELTDMVLAGYYTPVYNEQTDQVYAPALGETKVVISSLNRAMPNLSAQLSESTEPLLVKEMTLARLLVWDRAMLYLAQKLPEPYRSEYEPPNTGDNGFTGNRWYAGRYTGKDKEGFRKAFNEVYNEMGAAEMNKFIEDQRELDALYRTKVGD